MKEEPVTLEEVKCTKETEKALLVEFEGDEFWVPKSCVEEDSEVYGLGHEGTLVVTPWWARQKGLC